MSDYIHPFQDLYDQIPDVACKGHCGRDRHTTCCGPIGCSVIEAEALEDYASIRTDWKSSGDGSVRMNLDGLAENGYVCPHLGLDGRCQSYAARPLICRLFGAIKKLRCPWGCRPAKFLSEQHAHRLFNVAAFRSIFREQEWLAEEEKKPQMNTKKPQMNTDEHR